MKRIYPSIHFHYFGIFSTFMICQPNTVNMWVVILLTSCLDIPNSVEEYFDSVGTVFT